MLDLPKIVTMAAAVLLTATITMAQEIVDGGPTPTTARHGMHTCPVGYYMTGIDVGNNILLCNNIGAGFQEPQEVEDNSSADFGMHACPNGQVMSGFHDDRNLLLCVPPPSPGATIARFVDQPGRRGRTMRQNVHACPPGLPMAGIHKDNDYLLCEYRAW